MDARRPYYHHRPLEIPETDRNAVTPTFSSSHRRRRKRRKAARRQGARDTLRNSTPGALLRFEFVSTPSNNCCWTIRNLICGYFTKSWWCYYLMPRCEMMCIAKWKTD
ncbi:hypothetical protein ABEB36_001928 [Hypothenemus hampei]|uniref:Uncharacterized protein n=1 Tax=Hypothenemus hampei TaxID=57062 RepID=A0ABD1FG63_HYPHA